ncbi:hypothetical protein L9F63_013725, partial [Diploptera punctata]
LSINFFNYFIILISYLRFSYVPLNSPNPAILISKYCTSNSDRLSFNYFVVSERKIAYVILIEFVISNTLIFSTFVTTQYSNIRTHLE